MNRPSHIGAAAPLAAVGAGTVIATQVAGRATRDGLFLTYFDVGWLPAMFLAAATVSMVTLLWASRTMARRTPARTIPRMFAASSLLLVAEWGLWFRAPGLAAILLYLHTAALSAFLVSGFWSVINERFDPRSAKRKVSLITGGATLGGLVGGIVAERMAAWDSVAAMIPLMGALHLVSGLLVARLAPQAHAPDAPVDADRTAGPLDGVIRIARNVYLRRIALLVVLTAASATLLDFVFKARAVEVYGQGAGLTRFFALFHTAIGLSGFLLQTLLSRRILERLGLAGAAGTLPVVAGAGSLAALALPGLGPISIARGTEAAVSNSVFRSGYELLYTPVAVSEKRSAKSIIDVGVDRLADGLAAALIFVLLWLPAGLTLQSIAGVALVLSLVALLATRRLQQGYLHALRDRLVDRANDAPGPELAADTESMLMQTIGNLDLRTVIGVGRHDEGPPLAGTEQDPLVVAIADLRSGDIARVRSRLKAQTDPLLARQVVQLLAWDEISDDAVTALRRMCPGIVGDLTDALLDVEGDFAIRRRIPRVLGSCKSSRSAAGLLLGLEDTRFEVRFQCAAALSRIQSVQPETVIPQAHVLEIVRKELGVSLRSWTNRKLVDPAGVPEDTLLADRLDLGLTHVFRLLSLVFEREPLRVALRGLYTDDPFLRGTALEYLENLLPEDVSTKLNTYLPQDAPLPPPARQRDRDARSELLLSRHSIEVNLENLKKKS